MTKKDDNGRKVESKLKPTTIPADTPIKATFSAGVFLSFGRDIPSYYLSFDGQKERNNTV